MSIADTLLPEFDQEMVATRRVIERVPDGDPSVASYSISRSISPTVAGSKARTFDSTSTVRSR